MSDPLLTLADLFFADGGTFSRAQLKRIERSGETLKARNQLQEASGRLKWGSAWKYIGTQLPGLLDLPLLDIILAGWEKLRVLQPYTDPEAYPPGSEARVPLGKHTLGSTHRPRLELLWHGSKVGELGFTVQLKLELESFEATVRDGRIWRIDTGRCRGSGEVLVRDTVILERRLAQVRLPGRIVFDQGIPIPGPDSPYRPGAAADSLKPSADAGSSPGGGGRRWRKTILSWLVILGIGALAAMQTPRVVQLWERWQESRSSSPYVPPYIPPHDEGGHPQPRFSLMVEPVPPDARVHIVDSVEPYRTGMALPAGEYGLEVSRPGYHTARRVVHLVDRDLVIPVELEPLAPPPPPPLRPREEAATEPEPPPRREDGRHAVFLEVTPADARVTVYRSNPRKHIGDYHPGMRLAPGDYSAYVEVNAWRKSWVDFTVGDGDLHRRIKVRRSVIE